MMNTRLFTLHGKSFDEQQEFVNAMNARAEAIVASGGVWQMYNATRVVSVYPVSVQVNALGRKSVMVRALKGKPFVISSRFGQGKCKSASTTVWAEDLFKNETASVSETETASEQQTNIQTIRSIS